MLLWRTGFRPGENELVKFIPELGKLTPTAAEAADYSLFCLSVSILG